MILCAIPSARWNSPRWARPSEPTSSFSVCCFAPLPSLSVKNWGHGRCALLIPLFQLLSGVGVIGDAVFIHPPHHLVCDLVAFNSSLLVLFSFAWCFRRDVRWKGWSRYSIVTAILMMGQLTAFGFVNQHAGPAGAMEKLAAATRTLWSVLLAAKLLAGARLDPVLERGAVR